MQEHKTEFNVFAMIGERFIRTSHTFLALFPLIGELFLTFPLLFLKPQSVNWVKLHHRFINYGPASLLIILATNVFAIGLLVSMSSSYLVYFKSEILIIDFILAGLTRGIVPLLISLIMLLRVSPLITIHLYRMSPASMQTLALEEIWPRALALATALPMLYIYTFLTSLFIGAFFGKYSYQISLNHYYEHLLRIFNIKNFLTALISCVIYGFEIIFISSFYGIYYKEQHHTLSEALQVCMVTCVIILIGTNIFIINFVNLFGN